MTVKEWLNRARKLDIEIDSLEAAKAAAKGRCLSVTVRPYGTVVSGSAAERDGNLVAYTHLSTEIDRRIDELCAVKAEILNAIGAVEDGTLRTLLIERYINCKTWEQIAVDMHFNYRWVLRLHGKALQKVKEAIESHISPVL